MLTRRECLSIGLAAGVGGGLASLLGAIAPTAVGAADDSKQFEQTVTRAIDYLRVKGQAADGSYSA
ncbi:MAG TPA: hypothetical protein PLV92_10590, partial [Pirellulaceae bacterium]|nr:hypothetical protein [Pirellulaceae bacterium]